MARHVEESRIAAALLEETARVDAIHRPADELRRFLEVEGGHLEWLGCLGRLTERFQLEAIGYQADETLVAVRGCALDQFAPEGGFRLLKDRCRQVIEDHRDASMTDLLEKLRRGRDLQGLETLRKENRMVLQGRCDHAGCRPPRLLLPEWALLQIDVEDR